MRWKNQNSAEYNKREVCDYNIVTLKIFVIDNKQKKKHSS